MGEFHLEQRNDPALQILFEKLEKETNERVDPDRAIDYIVVHETAYEGAKSDQGDTGGYEGTDAKDENWSEKLN